MKPSSFRIVDGRNCRNCRNSRYSDKYLGIICTKHNFVLEDSYHQHESVGLCGDYSNYAESLSHKTQPATGGHCLKPKKEPKKKVKPEIKPRKTNKVKKNG